MLDHRGIGSSIADESSRVLTVGLGSSSVSGLGQQWSRPPIPGSVIFVCARACNR